MPAGSAVRTFTKVAFSAQPGNLVRRHDSPGLRVYTFLDSANRGDVVLNRDPRQESQDYSAHSALTDAAQARPMSTSLPLIEFDHPPVIETLLSVQFVPLRKLTLAYMGLYWGEVREEYPSHEVQPPLVPIVEEFPPKMGTGIGIALSPEPDARCWFIDSSSTQLIQIQRDRFIRNWRKEAPPNDRYPRYAILRPRFERDWAAFVSFLEREELGRPDLNQCEITYINHIERGAGWESFGDIASVLTPLATPSPVFLPRPEAIIYNARYAMPEKNGRLHVAAQPAIRRSDGKDILQVTLTARGKPASSRLEDIVQWFDIGHQWIVHGFADITTTEMHVIWGRR